MSLPKVDMYIMSPFCGVFVHFPNLPKLFYMCPLEDIMEPQDPFFVPHIFFKSSTEQVGGPLGKSPTK